MKARFSLRIEQVEYMPHRVHVLDEIMFARFDLTPLATEALPVDVRWRRYNTYLQTVNQWAFSQWQIITDDEILITGRQLVGSEIRAIAARQLDS
jgi:hypothetical protein